MLSLKNIVKKYQVGEESVFALNGVSLDFRRHEFVSILGPSGCGKTTLLNIIGGLDQYTSGDLEINGISTKKYREADWDTYRNHAIGFVFQSYNLIPHQTVLANVELALTLSGVSRAERRARAIDALRQVGLEDQIHKKPNQMSGGQMQRVAIARALVNDPDILLADEPTGALDTQTSVQIMEILHEISKSKLIIMVTHNPDLAEQYSSRIIRLLDGQVVGDSSPVVPTGETPDESPVETPDEPSPEPSETPQKERKRKKSMSFLTALSLSLNNLMTKKGRTFMTSFAGSIGIIGIALILSVSSGVNNYINAVQRETLASYPIQLEAESTDLTALVTSLMGANRSENEIEHEEGFVYESTVMVDLMNSVNGTKSTKNDLGAFKAYMDQNPELFSPYLSAVQYSYNFNWRILTKDSDGKVIKSDVADLFNSMSGGTSSGYGGVMGGSSLMASGYDVWEELIPGSDGELVHPLIQKEYDVVYGKWPESYDEVVLVISEDDTVSDLSLYALGLRTEKEFRDAISSVAAGNTIDSSEMHSYSYERLCEIDFRLFLASECYRADKSGKYVDISESEAGRSILYEELSGETHTSGIKLKVVGIIRPNPEATSTVIRGTIAYTAALTKEALDRTAQSSLIQQQRADAKNDILLGVPFNDGKELTDQEKIAYVKEYEEQLPNDTARAKMRRDLLSIPTDEEVDSAVQEALSRMDEEQYQEMLRNFLAENEIPDIDLDSIPKDRLDKLIGDYLKEPVRAKLIEAKQAQISMVPDAALLAIPLTDEQYLLFYEEIPAPVSSSTQAENLRLLGDIREDSPASIELYASTFENKDQLSKLIQGYNNQVDEEHQISYTDYVALLMSSITTIVNSISYVLIAFVSISLIVSSIMIGIITYISVLERTKEIGILRSIGASRRDVGHVFNAETLIVGFVAGIIGIGATLLLNQLITFIIFRLTDISNLKAVLPWEGALILILISMVLTLIAGLVPSGIAARKKPVDALRVE